MEYIFDIRLFILMQTDSSIIRELHFDKFLTKFLSWMH